jgi:hypothetical protein
MNHVVTRAACDVADDTDHRQDVAKDIENEIAIADCRSPRNQLRACLGNTQGRPRILAL